MCVISWQKLSYMHNNLLTSLNQVFTFHLDVAHIVK